MTCLYGWGIKQINASIRNSDYEGRQYHWQFIDKFLQLPLRVKAREDKLHNQTRKKEKEKKKVPSVIVSSIIWEHFQQA